MLSASNTLENELLLHIFQNAAITLIGDASGLLPSGTAGSLYISLHTADPGEAGNQSTSEIAYTSYARVAVARTSGQWTVSGNQANNINAVNFPAATGGSGTATHWGIGASSSGTGKLLFKAAISPTIVVSSGVTPILAATTGVVVTCD